MIEQRLGVREKLSGGALGIPRERLDLGTTLIPAIELYQRIPFSQRSLYIDEVRQILLNDRDAGVVASAMHLSYHLRLRELREEIAGVRGNRLRRFLPDERKFVQRERYNYLFYMSKTAPQTA